MGGLRLRDDRGRTLTWARPPSRIVSLVPSDTYSLARLGARSRLVGRTRYCVEPAEVDGVEVVGGTKDPELERVLALEPDLVIANQEENTQRDVERMEAEGLRVLVSFPRTVAAGVAHLARLAVLVGEGGSHAREVVREAYLAHRRAESRRAESRRAERAPARVFVPIWMDPLMTVHGDTFISDLLDLVGGVNVFAERARRYPLAADLGEGPALPPERTAGRDTRYPRVTLDEVRQRSPDVILLPDEPHAFSEADAEVFRALDVPAAREGRIRFVNGRDLMWPGARSLEGLDRIARALET